MMGTKIPSSGIKMELSLALILSGLHPLYQKVVMSHVGIVRLREPWESWNSAILDFCDL
jgi:hypothetical protein